MPEKHQLFPLSSATTLERRIEELTILCDVSRALQRTIDEEQALYTILVGLTHGRGFGFNRAFLLLVDREETSLRGRLAVGPSSPLEASAIWQGMREKHATLGEILDSVGRAAIKKDFLVNEIVAGFNITLDDSDNRLIQILRSHEACVAANGILEPSGMPVPKDLEARLGADNFAMAPLYLANKDLGILIADNAITRAPIDQTCLKLLQIYAQQTSAAIENTRLYQQLTEEISLCENTNKTLRESQDQLIRAERLTTMGKMAALLAHEIRTPLVSIGGFARRLLRMTDETDPRKEEMEIIVAEVIRLERLVEEVLGYAKLGTPEYRLLDINLLIRSVIAATQDEIERNHIRTVLELDPNLPQVQGDESQLRQAVLNLVTNAIDAMRSGGTLRIETFFDQKFVEISVSDTGTGIIQDDWDKLFVPFFTTKVLGTGLGLAIVSEVIDKHGGNLRFESVPEQGTSFHIRLVLHPERKLAASGSKCFEVTEEVVP